MDLCRACLTSSMYLNNLFENLNDQLICPAIMLNTFLPYSISEDDGLPATICSACVAKLQIAYTFLIDFAKSQQALIDDTIATSNEEMGERIIIETEYDEEDEGEDEKIIIETHLDDDEYGYEENGCVQEEIIIETDDVKEELAMFAKQDLILNEMVEDSVAETPIIKTEIEPETPPSVGKEGIPQIIRESERYFCPVCEYITDRYRDFSTHIRNHDDTSIETIECNYCAKIFLKDGFAVHSKMHRYPCNACDRTFKTPYGNWYHRATSHNEFKKEFKCTYADCNQTFLWDTHRLKHEQVHSLTKQYLCEECGASFKTYDMHRFHTTRVHQHRNLTVCDLCGKKFVQRSHYLDHMWVHTGKKRHQCKYCGVRVSKYGGLRKHVARCPKKIVK